ncbi:MAG: hypothetical protein ACKORA_08730 [Solirubrobacterales bacterium]
MAPRRLIIAMVLLLVLSTALAVLVPQPRPPEQTGTGDRPGDGPQTGQVEPEPEPKPREPNAAQPRKVTPGLVEATVTTGGPTRRIRVEAGDRLILEVRSRRAALVELGGTGLVDTVGPYDPAIFDVLARSRGERLLAREVETGRKIALVVVR